MAAYGALSSLLLTLENVLDDSLTVSLNRDRLVYLRERANELRQYLGSSYSPDARSDDELESLETRIRGVVFRAEDLLARRMYKDRNPLCSMSSIQNEFTTGFFGLVGLAGTMFRPRVFHSLFTSFFLVFWLSLHLSMPEGDPINHPLIFRNFFAMCLQPLVFDPENKLRSMAIYLSLIALYMVLRPSSLLNILINWFVRTDDKILTKLLEDFNSIATEVITVGTDANDAQQQPTDLSSTASSSKHYFVGTSCHNPFVGMRHELEEIKSRLLGQAKSVLKIIPVTGMSGIGKTTLVTQIYNDHDVRHHFDVCAWATISQEGHFHKVVLDLLKSANVQLGNMHEGLDDGELGVHLYQRLNSRRYLIVMDDVWDKKIWDDVKQFFPNDENGSCVLLTTQLSEVAHYANFDGPIHQLRFLDEDESQKLLEYRAFGGEDCPHELREIQNEIVQVCKGLPLTLTLTGGMLSQIAKTRETWKSFVDNLRSSTTNDDECTKILEFSYKRLPYHLRCCFLYMGIFPEDYEISVTKLIHLWVAEGFFQHDSTRSMEELAGECLKNLVERNLISVSKWSSHGKIKRCKIHDALRKLCLHVGQKENFLFILNRQQDVSRTGIEFSRRLSFHSNILKLCPDIIYGKKLGTSTIHSLVCIGAKASSPQWYKMPYKLLKVLDLLTLHFTRFPLAVTKLVCLRYLALTFTGLFHPNISKLQNLHTIVHRDMFSSKNSYLPMEIWMMPNLRHLNVPAACLSSSPSGSGALALQTLVEVINLSFGIQVVRRIKSLRKLSVSYDVDQLSFRGWSEHKLENLVCLRELEILKFGVVDFGRILDPPDLAFPPSLNKLTLSGCRIPWERLKVVAALPNLEVLKLRYNACQGEVWNLTEERFGQLKSLQLEYMDDLLHWVASEMHFPRLRCLTIKSCPQLKEIPSSIGDIATLERIDVVDCRHDVVTSAKNIRDEQVWSMGDSDLKVTAVYLSYEFKYHN